MQACAGNLHRRGKTIALVPTMGYLHAGHLALMRLGRKHADVLVASIFVNPTQFAPSEDFESYPRDMARDSALAAKASVDILFTPDGAAMYEDGFQTYVSLAPLSEGLCGRSRPIFFRGVATVVAKLFNIIQPETAIFGEKDFQQLTVIRRMVRDLNFGTAIIGHPTVREPDGLAMSSRNAYLKPVERPAALSLYRALNQAREMVLHGERDAPRIVAVAADLIRAQPGTEIDYITIVDPENLTPLHRIEGPARMALAVKIGKTRLIDNMALNP
jgi:pantoate--beta-alanine ligase